MTIRLKKGLDIPICGAPRQVIEPGNEVREIALLGMDYVGLKPTMAVREGDRVAAGQLLFTDKKNPGINFTAPVSGTVTAIHRGPRRRFESLVIRIEGERHLSFPPSSRSSSPDAVRALLLQSGMWTAVRTRPYGKIPQPDAGPSSLFVTAMDTLPLAPDPMVVINSQWDDFLLGLELMAGLAPQTFVCIDEEVQFAGDLPDGTTISRFAGPHPAGLPSTHIHFLDPVRPGRQAWHIGYQDVIAIGHLHRTGSVQPERVVALTGPAMRSPRLVTAPVGASVNELCCGELHEQPCRLIGGSALSGHGPGDNNIHAYLGRYEQQVCALPDKDGSGLFSWLQPGRNRFSSLPLFASAFFKKDRKRFCMSTAAWGGRRAIIPLGTYEQVMPLDIIATALLKAIASGRSEKASQLGCLELVEEDLALCSFVCPGKNNFGPMLRDVLTVLEEEG